MHILNRHCGVCCLAAGVIVGPTAMIGPVTEARTINFSGYTWDVKNGNGLGPGPNNWSDSTDSVWIDGAGDLHLKIRRSQGKWYSAEVTNQTVMGYGKYEFRIQTNPEPFDKNVVVGLFNYENDTEEIDIEFARWGNANAPTYAQYGTQPTYVPGNKHDFDMTLSGDYSTHIFEWTPNEIIFTSIHGHHSSSPPGTLIETWTYTGSDIPLPSGEKVHMNLWLFQGNRPSNNQAHELVIDSFTFTPYSFAGSTPEPTTAALLALLAWPVLIRRGR